MRMNGESAKRRLQLRNSDKVILGIVAVMAVVTVALNILQRFGLSLINGAVMVYLPCVAVAVLMGWGLYLLTRLIRNSTVRRVVTVVLVVLMFLLLTVVLSYVGFLASVTMPQQYRAIASPGGKVLVVLRALDPDDGRISQRHEARLEADPQGDPELTVDDWGYRYAAYPRTLGLFYRSDADVEGEVYMGYSSDAAMMVDWSEDGTTARFYLENPRPGDGGECTVKLE